MNNEWLKNLKVGDKVVIDAGYNGKSISTVSRITKTMIITKTINSLGNAYESRFRLTDGFSVGEGNTFRKTILREFTLAVVAELKFKRMCKEFSAINPHKLSTDQLEEILKIANPTNGTTG